MKVLFLGAHCDDIELSCGGTIYKHRADWDIFCLIFSHESVDGQDLLDCQKRSLELLNVEHYEILDHPPLFMYEKRQTVWEDINRVKDFGFDVVFTHAPDEQQDHVVVYDETVRNFQTCTVVKYPTIRSLPVHDVNYFESLSEEDATVKRECLKHYDMYKDKFYFSDRLILSQLIYYGGYIQTPFAEAYTIKQFVDCL